MTSHITSMPSTLQSQVHAGISRRDDFPLNPSKAALLIIDVQKYLTSCPAQVDEKQKYFWLEAVPRMLKNLQRLTGLFREVRDRTSTGSEVIFVFLQSITKDGRDISLDYKLSGPQLAGIPRFGESDLFLEELQPEFSSGKGDILVPKTSCSVFQSTNIDYLLRNLGIEQVVIAGQLTDQCVESAVRDAADLGYFVTVAQDACAANSDSAHRKGLQSMKGFSRIIDSSQVLSEIQAARMHPSSGPSKNGRTESEIVAFLKKEGFEDAVAALKNGGVS